MKCDFCDNEATVHEVTVRNGVKVERHLCEAHATQQGITVQPAHEIGELIKQIATPRQTQGRSTLCPSCRTTFSEFKQNGLLGCEQCYRAFEVQLGLLIERAHEGGVAHIGKTPRRNATGESGACRAASDLAERAARLARVRADLEAAVKSEEYERAARLRDELRRLDEGGRPRSA